MISRQARAPRLLAALFAWCWLAFAPAPHAHAQQTASVSGVVTDAEDGQPLPGANVALLDETDDIAGGTATDATGAYSVAGLAPGAYTLRVTFIGYERTEQPLTLAPGEAATRDVALSPETSALEQVVVSASRRQEKVLDAPASISVLEPEQLEAQVTTSSIEALNTTTGVDMAQTGLDRREVVLRGFNNAFSGATFVLTDYRQSAVPSLGVNIYSIMPTQSIDLKRVEVVRGPGSALYGPGVANGVIHFFTKDPFDYPGATVSVSGGQRSFFNGEVRMAGTLTERLGVKFTGSYAQGNEWELSLDNPQDAEEIESYRTYASRDAIPGGRSFQGLDTDGDDTPDSFRLRRNYDYQKFNANGLIQFLATDATTISLNGGFSQLTAPVQSGIGTLQADGFGYAYGQLRVQSGGFFGQVFLNANDAGDSYVYGSGQTVADNGLQWNGQLQYRFDVAPFETSIITGTDINLIEPRTEGRITGRNEGDDSINLYGAYAQTTSSLTDQFDLTLAFRGDYNNVQDQVNLSPRAALVFKANGSNTVRASYNRAVSAPGTNSNFLDIEAQRQSVGGGNDLVFRGLGAAGGYTFDDFRTTNRLRFSIPTLQLDLPVEYFGTPLTLDQLPYLPVLGLTFGSLQQQLAEGNIPEGFSQAEFQAFVQAAGAVAQAQGATSNPLAPGQAVLGIPDGSDLGYREVEGPTDIAPLEQTTTQTVEVGYKGIFASKLLLTIDAFYERKNNFIGPLLVESPLAYFDPAFLAGRIGELSASPQVQGAIQQFANARGIPFDEAVRQLAGAFSGTPTAVVQPDQDVLPGNESNEVGGFLSYRNFGQVEYFGIDVNAELRATDQLDVFANASYISDDFFDNEELDEANQDLSIALNAPQFKTRGGLRYRFENGLGFNGAATYTEGFPVQSGPYVGDVQSYFLVDLGITYDFQSTVPGLRLAVTAKNVLDNDHREFVGAPLLGRLILGRLTYTLPVGNL